MSTTGAAGAVGRVIALFVPRRSTLRRRSDRIEVAALWVVLLAVLLVVPVALTVGSEVAASLTPSVEAQRAERHQVIGRVVAAPQDDRSSSDGVLDGVRAPVGWIAADGTPRTAVVPVPVDARPGDPRVLWLDRADRLTRAPPSPAEPAEQGLLTALFLVLGALTAGLVVTAVLRRVLDRARMREWDAAWRRFTGPDTEPRH